MRTTNFDECWTNHGHSVTFAMLVAARHFLAPIDLCRCLCRNMSREHDLAIKVRFALNLLKLHKDIKAYKNVEKSQRYSVS